MQIGLSSASFYPLIHTEQSLNTLNTMGFKVAELFLNSFSEYEADFINILNEEINKNNITINSIHAFSSSFEPYIFDAYERRRKDMINIFKRVCKATKLLNCNIYNFHGMRKMEFNSINKKMILDIYNELCYIASENQICLSQENVCWCMSADLDFMNFLKKELRYPIKFTLDLKQAYKAEVEPLEYLKIMGDDLVNFHINDKDKSNPCLLPGKGEIEYEEIFRELKKNNYGGNAIIEIYKENFNTLGEITESKLYLEDIIHRVGV